MKCIAPHVVTILSATPIFEQYICEVICGKE